MTTLTRYTSYADAMAHFSGEALWDLFDGDRERPNIAHECIDRHASDPRRVAVRIAHADGGDESLTFDAISRWSARFAHFLREEGVEPGGRVAVMLEPSVAFYACLFGAIKCAAVAVPMFTLFGPDGIRLRLEDCSPRFLVTDRGKASALGSFEGVTVLEAGDAFLERLAAYPEHFEPGTAASDLAAFQYTSGTTRALPEAIHHTHRAVVLVCIAALYGTGIRPGDEFFCPSSPAWGHGMWRETFDESLDVLMALLSREEVSWDGKYYRFEPLMIDELAEYAELGVERFILNVNFGAEQSQTMECIQRFAEDVLPHFTAGPEAPARAAG